MDPQEIARRNFGAAADQPRPPHLGGPTQPVSREDALNRVRSRFRPGDLRAKLAGALPPPVLGQIGMVTAQNDPLAATLYPEAPTAGGTVDGTNSPVYSVGMTPVEQQVIQGSYFDFPLSPDAAGNIWGNIGEGPEGYQWNVNGSVTSNAYIPGYFGDEQPPVLQFPPLFTQREFESRHLFGFQSLLSQWSEWSNVYHTFYHQAVDAIEQAFGGFIYPRLILTDGIERGFRPGIDFDLEEREYDFNAQQFYHWGWMRLRYGPVMSILNLNMVYPTGQMILDFPPAWIKPQMLSGEIRLVPPQGAISQVVLGPGGYLVMLVGGTMTDMPALLFCDYIAGMWPIPQGLKRAIELRLALMVFPVLSDAIAKGRSDVVTTVDQVQYRRLFTTRSDVQGLSGRMNQYQAEMVTLVRQARSRYLGSVSTKKFTAL